MKIRLTAVDAYDDRHVSILYRLLSERTPEQSISHAKMPKPDEHRAFVRRNPYQAWYLIEVGGAVVGAIYLSWSREVGLFIFAHHQRKGYGKAAAEELMTLHPGRFLANVNPSNMASCAFWEALGFAPLQVTYASP